MTQKTVTTEWLVYSPATQSWYPCDSEDEARDLSPRTNTMGYSKIARRTTTVEVEEFDL